MPVVLENGSERIRTWLDPNRSTWSAELQSLLKPYKGELEIYPVSKEVGKVGNNSPAFIVPVASSENKQNIANFFANAKGADQTKGKSPKEETIKAESIETPDEAPKIDRQTGEDRKTIKEEDGTENNAPVPVPSSPPEEKKGQKRKHAADAEDDHMKEEKEPSPKVRRGHTPAPKESGLQGGTTASTTRKTRSATSNETAQRAKRSTPKKSDGKGSQKITSFFDK